MTTLTTRTLRETLFYLSNQNMTVAELRSLLYSVVDQDAELEPRFGMFLKIEAQETARLEREAELLAFINS